MTATAHALIAGAIANKFADPALSMSLAFFSHYIIDSVPHWDFGTDWRKRSKTATGLLAIADTLFAFVLTFALYQDKVPAFYLFWVICASLVADWLEAPFYIFFANPGSPKAAPTKNLLYKITSGIYQCESSLHHKAPFLPGLLTQVATVIFFMILLK